MSSKIAFILQGKNSPHYRANKVDTAQRVIVINSRYTWIPGKDRYTKTIYRHYTGKLLVTI
jgi:ribosomal protein L13